MIHPIKYVFKKELHVVNVIQFKELCQTMDWKDPVYLHCLKSHKAADSYNM